MQSVLFISDEFVVPTGGIEWDSQVHYNPIHYSKRLAVLIYL